MLKTNRKITLEGTSTIDGVIVSKFTAAINSEDPNQMTLSSVQINKAAYKANRDAVRTDEAAFEDYAFSLQDSMLADVASTDK